MSTRKFIQYTAVLGSVLTVLGFGTAAAAHVHGGRWSQMQIWRENIYPRKHHASIPAGADKGTLVEEGVKSFPCRPEFSVDVDFGSLTLRTGESDRILVYCRDMAGFDSTVWAYADKDEVKIEVVGKKLENWKPEIEVVVPSDYVFEETAIQLGGGHCTIQGLNAMEFSGETAAGELYIDASNAANAKFYCAAGSISYYGKVLGDVELECAAGNISYTGEILGNVDAQCAAGNIYLEVLGKEEDFDYEVSGTGGNIKIGSRTFSGMMFEEEKPHGASREMDLECAAGSIEVQFKESGLEAQMMPETDTAVEELPMREAEMTDE